jgi:hypothetical protein
VKLERTRTLAELLGDAFALYGVHLRAFLAIGLAIVVPVELIVGGIGLGQLGGRFDADVSLSELLIGAVTTYLVTAPLVTSMVILTLRGAARRTAIQDGLELFVPVLVAVILVALAAAIGLLALVIPAVIAVIRLLFVTQAVVLDGRRGPDALARSWELSRGSFWRILGVQLLAMVTVQLAGSLVAVPFVALAKAADREVIALIGTILSQALTLPLVATITTLLYFDLRERAAVPAAPA